MSSSTAALYAKLDNMAVDFLDHKVFAKDLESVIRTATVLGAPLPLTVAALEKRLLVFLDNQTFYQEEIARDAELIRRIRSASR